MVRYPIIIVLFIVLLLYNNAQCAILDDSTIIVLAKWNKHERHLFRYSEFQYEVKNGDTIKHGGFNRDFTIEVDDSTEHLFSLCYEREKLPLINDSIVLDEKPLRLMTNRNGALIKVLNWDSYLDWRNNDVEKTSDALFPFVSLLSFNGKKLRLNNFYRGQQLVNGQKVGMNGMVESKSEMIVSRDYEYLGEFDLVTIKTKTSYIDKNNEDSPIPFTEEFTQVIDSYNGWAIATYFEQKKQINNGVVVDVWNIKLLN